MLSFQLRRSEQPWPPHGVLNLYGPGQPDEQLQSCATSPRSLRRPAVPVQPATADKANISCSDAIHLSHVVHPVLGRAFPLQHRRGAEDGST